MGTADELILNLLNEISFSRLGRAPTPSATVRPPQGPQISHPTHDIKPNQNVDSGGEHKVLSGGISSERPRPSARVPVAKFDRYRSPKTRMPQPIMTTRRNFGKKHGTNLWRQRT